MTSPPVARLAARNLVVSRENRQIVRDVDLDVLPGRVTALLGANGAGKTTLIEGLTGRLPVTSGDVLIDGRSCTRDRPVRRARAGLATVEQGRTVFTSMTVADNLRIAADDRAAIDAALEHFPELRPKLGLRAGLLSGGEQQMLVLARALVSSPRVLLIDEMSLGLAPVVVRRLLPLLREMAVASSLGVLVVEQFAVLALQAADDAYVLRRGGLTYAGPAADLAADPDRLHEAYFGAGPSGSTA